MTAVAEGTAPRATASTASAGPPGERGAALPPDGSRSPLSRWWAGLTRGQRVFVAVLGFVLGLNVALVGLRSAVGGSPGGPVSSSFSTGGGGLEAFADLARVSGHEVTRLKETPEAGSLPVEATVVLADPRRVSQADVDALERFVRGGGRLVVAGEATAPLVGAASTTGVAWELVEPVEVIEVVDAPPVSGGGAAGDPEPALGAVRWVTGDAGGRWANAADSTVLLSDADGRALIVALPVGSGTLVAVADADLLHNRNLALEDNAALGLELIGGDGRPVVFFESVHGFGATGIDALPSSWKWTGAGLVLALAVGLWWAAGRFGPPEPFERELRPARLEHVRAVAANLDRVSVHPAELVGPLVEANRVELADRLGVDVDSSPSVWQRAAETGGMDPDVVVTGTSTPSTIDEALYVGALAAHHRRISTEPITVAAPSSTDTDTGTDMVAGPHLPEESQ